jgi:tRNA A-37 threonylcarbamoyl transferase component Bud32
MGVVVEALHMQLDERVALKFLLPEFAYRPEFAERFVREARAAVKIKGEHVTKVSDVGTLDNGAPYMVMELLDGADLSSILQNNGPLPLHDAVDYVIQAAEALAEAHQAGIIHRDIKPANMFLARRSDGSSIVKVLDFGISKIIGGTTDGLTKTTATMGSALYMAPEQMRQAKSVDHRADIYALGISLYELLAGKQPYLADTLPELCALVLTGTPTPLREVRPDLPPQFAAVLERSYEREREQRYQSVAEFAFALAPFATPRSRTSLDRIARFAGHAAPVAHAPTAWAPQQNAPQLTVPAAPAGGMTNASLARSNGPMPAPTPASSSKTGLVVAGLLVLGVGGAVAVFATGLHTRFIGGATAAATAPPAEQTSAPAEKTGADDAPKTEPAGSAASEPAQPEASASTSASADAAPSASAPEKTAGTSKQPVKQNTKPSASSAPQPPKTSTPTNVFDHR